MEQMAISKVTIDAFIKELSKGSNPPEFLYPCSDNDDYARDRKVFNRRFNFMPALIMQPKTAQHVATAVAFAQKRTMPFTVKSGGHDHEGECVATGKVLIDFKLMKQVCIDVGMTKLGTTSAQQISIQPGARFEDIKPVLDAAKLAIAHGTCKTVAIAGYTMGGGWGPWTRKYGMGCERLSGATMIIGDGSIRYLGSSADINKQAKKEGDDELLIALRGGGGLSYGIVTEFYFIPINLPKIAVSFSIKHDTFKNDKIKVLENLKAVTVIEAWEKLISPGVDGDNEENLIGTNLQLMSSAVKDKQSINKNVILPWTFNGHFAGSVDELELMFNRWGRYLKGLIDKDKQYSPLEKKLMKAELQLAIDKFILKQLVIVTVFDIATVIGKQIHYPLQFDVWDRMHGGLSLEDDKPAPHKITSKMASSDWDDRSRNQLVCSLQSTLLDVEAKTNIDAYVTLGAISGQYYFHKNNPLNTDPNVAVSFPYQHSLFTIQYQAWWDQPDSYPGETPQKQVQRMLASRCWENRAQDWIANCRNNQIDKTCGSFISFKDASIPTEDYFGDNYNLLKNTKEQFSLDTKNLFRSRKTII
jgi:hypothetical protein